MPKFIVDISGTLVVTGKFSIEAESEGDLETKVNELLKNLGISWDVINTSDDKEVTRIIKEMNEEGMEEDSTEFIIESADTDEEE